MTDRQGRRREDDDAFAERVARPLRAPERVGDEFESALLTAISEGRPLRPIVPRRMPALSPAWWSASTIRLSPLASLAIAAGIAAIAVFFARRATPPASVFQPAVVASAPVHDTVTFVRFVFVGRAKSVAIVGDFNGWGGRPTTLDQTAAGAWTTSVPLTNGRHEYAFVVDGERWVADPLAPSSSDEFETKSSVITVGTE